jgi:hypothetical protein
MRWPSGTRTSSVQTSSLRSPAMTAARRTHPVGGGVPLLGRPVHHPACWWTGMSLIGSRHDPACWWTGMSLIGSRHDPACWWTGMSLIGSRHDPEPYRDPLAGLRPSCGAPAGLDHCRWVRHARG